MNKFKTTLKETKAMLIHLMLIQAQQFLFESIFYTLKTFRLSSNLS